MFQVSVSWSYSARKHFTARIRVLYITTHASFTGPLCIIIGLVNTVSGVLSNPNQQISQQVQKISIIQRRKNQLSHMYLTIIRTRLLFYLLISIFNKLFNSWFDKMGKSSWLSSFLKNFWEDIHQKVSGQNFELQQFHFLVIFSKLVFEKDCHKKTLQWLWSSLELLSWMELLLPVCP